MAYGVKKSEKPAAKKDGKIDHGQLVEWVNEADDATQDSRQMSEKCRNYYDSKQWSEAEARKLKKQKQAATVINRIKPKIDGLMGMERANKTTAKAFPRTPQHEKASQAATESIRFVLQDNFYDQKRSGAWDNLLVEGTGGIEVCVKPKGDGFRIFINHVMWDRIIYDPHSRFKDFRDARYLGQVVWMDYDLALEEYSDGKDVLETMIGASTSTGQTYEDKPRWMDTKRKRVKIVELYYRQGTEVWYSCFTMGGYLKAAQISAYKNEEGETEWPYEFASLFVDLEGDRYGAVLQYLDVQDEINKRRSKALHLMSVRQVMIERGASEDINKTRDELAKPDGIVEVTPGMLFEVLKTGDMAAAQFNLLAEAKAEIDNVGYNAAASGKDMRAMSGVALENRKVASQTEIAPMFDVLKHLDVRVYRKVWNRIKQYWKEEKWIRVTDDPANLRWVGLNAPMTKGQQMLEAAQQQGMPPEQLQQMAQQIAADQMMQEVVSTQNDIAELDVDIVIDDAPDTVTMQQEEFTALGEMVKSGIPIPPSAIVAASSLKDKDKILKEMKEQGGVPPELQEQMKKMQEEGQKLAQENQQLKADQSTEIAKIQVKQQGDMMELEHKKQIQAMELQLERERAQAEIEIMRAKAEADIAIKQMQLQCDKEATDAKMKMDGEAQSAKLQMDAQMGDQKMQQEEKMNEHKIATETKAQETKDQGTAMPQFLKALDKIMQEFGKVVEANAKTNTEIVKAITKPKTVILGGIQRNDAGITGASATVQ